eukprot:scaffold48448_cov18-Tisochrysis_lutea.AAC.2
MGSRATHAPHFGTPAFGFCGNLGAHMVLQCVRLTAGELSSNFDSAAQDSLTPCMMEQDTDSLRVDFYVARLAGSLQDLDGLAGLYPSSERSCVHELHLNILPGCVEVLSCLASFCVAHNSGSHPKGP